MTRRTEHESHIERQLERLVDLGETQCRLLGSIESTLFAIHDDTSALVALLIPAQSTTAVLTGETMTIPSGGTTTVTLTFVDAATGTEEPPPTGDGSGLVVTITADSPLVTLGDVTLSGDTATATATAGDATSDTPFNYIANVANTSGAELFDDDGTTPFVQPAALASTVTAAVPPPPQATTAVLSEG